MIYLKNTTDAQEVYIPKSQRGVSGNLIFSARNTIDLTELIRSEVADLDTSFLYYRLFLVIAEELPVGEYEYTLSDDAGILSQGLMMVGEFSSPVEYNKSIEYEQYENE